MYAMFLRGKNQRVGGELVQGKSKAIKKELR